MNLDLQRFGTTSSAEVINGIIVGGDKARTIKIVVAAVSKGWDSSFSQDGNTYMAGSDGKLAVATVINGAQWLNATPSFEPKWVYLPAGASAYQNTNTLDLSSKDARENTTIQITNVAGVSGTATAATATLSGGSAISDVTVTGSGVSNFRVTIGGTEYGVNANGKLEVPEVQISGAQWRANPAGGTNWVFLPAGATAMVNSTTGAMSDTSATAIQMTNVSNVTGNGTAATATLASGKAVSDVTVTGSAISGLTVAINSVQYYVSSNKLAVLYSTINGAQWRANGSQWVYLPSGASATLNNKTGNLTGTSTTVLQISGVANVTGDDSDVTATLASGCAISDVTVTGSAAGGLTVTVGGTAYSVNSSGKLVKILLLSKAEASETYLSKADASSTYLTQSTAASTYLGKSDKAASAATADNLSASSNFRIQDSSRKYYGTNMVYTGAAANMYLRMPAVAAFTNIILGTDTSTVEGAMWIEWS